MSEARSVAALCVQYVTSANFSFFIYHDGCEVGILTSSFSHFIASIVFNSLRPLQTCNSCERLLYVDFLHYVHS